MNALLQALSAGGTGPQLFRQELERKVRGVRTAAWLSAPIDKVKVFIAPAVAGEEMLALFSMSLRHELEIWVAAEISEPSQWKADRETVNMGVPNLERNLVDITAVGSKERSLKGEFHRSKSADRSWSQGPNGNDKRVRSNNPTDRIAINNKEHESWKPAVPVERGVTQFNDIRFSARPYRPNVSRLQTAVEKYHSMGRATFPLETDRSRSFSAMRRIPEALRSKTYREIVAAQAGEQLWPYSSNTEVATRNQAHAEIAAAATADQRTDEPVLARVQRNGPEWLLDQSQEPGFQKETAGGSSEDLADLISTILREQALAHGIDLT